MRQFHENCKTNFGSCLTCFDFQSSRLEADIVFPLRLKIVKIIRLKV